MAQPTLNSRQARWLFQLALYDFIIYYRKGYLNPADGPSRRSNYADPDDVPHTIVAQLMPTLGNKLVIASYGAGE